MMAQTLPLELPHLNDSIAVSLADVVPLLVHASKSNRVWMDDFSDDIVQISRDLYEILIAYQAMVTERAA
jgi:hypothetical protein